MTVSKTSSPEADDTFTGGVVLLPVALAKVPNGTLWSTPVKVITPTILPPSGAVEKVTTTSAVPVVGATNWYIHTFWNWSYARAPTRDNATPPYVTPDTSKFGPVLAPLIPKSIRRFVPDPVAWDTVIGEVVPVPLDVASTAGATAALVAVGVAVGVSVAVGVCVGVGEGVFVGVGVGVFVALQLPVATPPLKSSNSMSLASAVHSPM